MFASEKYDELTNYLNENEFYALDVATTAFGMNDETIDSVLYAMFGYEYDNINEIFAGIRQD